MTAKDKRQFVLSVFNWLISNSIIKTPNLDFDSLADSYIETNFLPQALETLKKHQQWLNGGVGEVIPASELSEANETIINYVENMLK